MLHQRKRNVRISSKSQREKTPSNSDFDYSESSDSESRSILPNPPTLTMTNMPVTKPSTSKPLESIEEVVQVIDGSIVSHKSNGFWLYLLSAKLENLTPFLDKMEI